LPPCLWRGLRLLRGFLRSLRASCNLASGFFPLSGLCGLHSSPGELLQCSDVSLLGLGGSSGGGSAVLLGSRDGGGREVDLRLGEDQPFLLRRRGVSTSPGGVEVVEQV